MKKEYRYQKIFHWSLYAIPLIVGIWIVLPWIIIFLVLLCKMGGLEALWSYIYWSPLPVLLPLAVPLCFYSFSILFTGIFLWYLYWRIAGISITFNDKAIFYKYRGGEKIIQFDEIIYLKFSSLPYLGGWIKIASKTDTIRLTVALSNIGDFLKKLKEALDNRGLSDRYHTEKFFRFFKTAVSMDQSWQRLYKIFWKLILITVIAGIIGFVFVRFLQYQKQSIKPWLMISALWPTIIYSFTEIIFARRIAKKSAKESFTCPPRDIAYEKSIYRKAILIGVLLYFAVSAVAFILLG